MLRTKGKYICSMSQVPMAEKQRKCMKREHAGHVIGRLNGLCHSGIEGFE